MRFIKLPFLLTILAMGNALAQNHTGMITPNSHYYGAVDLGSSGVKAQLYSFLIEDESRKPDILFGETINTKLVSSMRDGNFTPEGIADAANAVKQVVDSMKGEATKRKLNIDTYYVVGSSGAARASNKQDLVAAVKAATDIDMDFVDAKTEGYYGLVSAVPLPRRATSIYIDIGSGNTKVGCVVGDVNLNNFKSLEIPFGSKSALPEAKKRNPTDVVAGLSSLMKDIGATYDTQSEDTPCLKNRQRIYWTGGAAWATASFMHPEAAFSGSVTITRQDLDKFISELQDGTWDQKKLVFIFPKDTSPERQAAIRRKADSEINDSKNGVINIFTRDQILAGASIMKTVLTASNPSATLKFVREGNFIFGVALDKFKADIK
jgi:exopolyphosphatase/pppGpp-phosphohydrolase